MSPFRPVGPQSKRTMPQSPVILIVEDDEGHAILVRDVLETAGLNNRIVHFRDGQSVLDFLFGRNGILGQRLLTLAEHGGLVAGK